MFPDLAWVVRQDKRSIIFCKTISMVFRVFVYLWDLLGGTPQEKEIKLRMYTSLFEDSYNLKTRKLMHETDPSKPCTVGRKSTVVRYTAIDSLLRTHSVIRTELKDQAGQAPQNPLSYLNQISGPLLDEKCMSRH
jgi:hypothetical protein